MGERGSSCKLELDSLIYLNPYFPRQLYPMSSKILCWMLTGCTRFGLPGFSRNVLILQFQFSVYFCLLGKFSDSFVFGITTTFLFITYSITFRTIYMNILFISR